ncbi:hypothetical protein [Roseomonas gilardii]|uniref:hypothetical protein n=1 Tax=Roseomonas gilardii TaxID=257708 RepID=UPI00119E239E|nr:hypothetical protein [Roseomonas gilardii]
MPQSVFVRRAMAGANGEPEFSASMSIFGPGSGMASEAMNTLVRTTDREKGQGALNRGRYSNPALDALLEQVDSTFDEEKRRRLTVEAQTLVVQDGAMLPVFYVNSTWALRRDLTMRPSADQYTYATGIRPAP